MRKHTAIYKTFLFLLILSLLAGSLFGCYVSVPSEQSNDSVSSVPHITSPSEDDDTSVLPDDAGLEIHFLDVGQSDSTIIVCDGKAMIIDGGESENSGTIYAYLQTLEITHLDYVIATHAHADHVGGLAGAINFATVGTAFAPVENDSSEGFTDFVNYLEKQDKSITVPAPGDTFVLGSAEVTILGPVEQYDDKNNTSIVLRIVYGKTSFLFTGDAEKEAELDVLASGRDLESTVLNVGHHGSSTSSCDEFLDAVDPDYAVISCGKDNSYGHPHDEVVEALTSRGIDIYRTDLNGTVVCVSDGSEVMFAVRNNPPIMTEPDVTTEEATFEDNETEHTYVLNINSMKFHYDTCSSIDNISKGNKELYTGTRKELIEGGYSPCGSCKP